MKDQLLMILSKRIPLGVVLAAALSIVTLMTTAEIEEDTHQDEVLQAYGWIIGKQSGLFMDYSEQEIEQIVIGFKRAAKSDSDPANIEQLMPQVEEMVKGRATAFQKIQKKLDEEKAQKNEAANTSFFNALKLRKEIQKTASGLYYEILEEGSDKIPDVSSSVKIHYHGTLISGAVFDSSKERGQPAQFSFNGGVIPGFSEGLQLIGEGGRIKLYIPPELGYGNRRAGSIPPGSALIFEVELLEANLEQ